MFFSNSTLSHCPTVFGPELINLYEQLADENTYYTLKPLAQVGTIGQV